jgi:hypothetical protein
MAQTASAEFLIWYLEQSDNVNHATSMDWLRCTRFKLFLEVRMLIFCVYYCFQALDVPDPGGLRKLAI